MDCQKCAIKKNVILKVGEKQKIMEYQGGQNDN